MTSCFSFLSRIKMYPNKVKHEEVVFEEKEIYSDQNLLETCKRRLRCSACTPHKKVSPKVWLFFNFLILETLYFLVHELYCYLVDLSALQTFHLNNNTTNAVKNSTKHLVTINHHVYEPKGFYVHS